MARASVLSTQRSANSVREPNGIPPPSTIAAQIVNHHAQSSTAREPEKKAIFAQLLQDYLKDTSSAEEPDPDVNAQLVTVVAEAGLSGFTENPFDQQTLIAQAIDSLYVIELILKRTPELILFRTTQEDDSKGPRLFTTLLPKILFLVGRNGLDELQQHLCSLLVGCFKTLHGSGSLWRESMSLLDIYKGIVEAVLQAFDRINSDPSASIKSFKVSLPPTDGIFKVWPESQHLVALPPGCQMVVASSTQATIIARSFLEVITQCQSRKLKASLKAHSSNTDRSWLLETCGRLWSSFQAISSHAFTLTQRQIFQVRFLQLLDEAFYSQKDGYQSLISLPRSLTIVTDVYSDLFSAAYQEHESLSLEGCLAWSLMRLLSMTRTTTQYGVQRQQIQMVESLSFRRLRRLLLTLPYTYEGASGFSSPDLKVAISAAFGHEMAEKFKDSYLTSDATDGTRDSMPKFTDPTLEATFASLLLQGEETGGQTSRPTKRIKLNDRSCNEHQSKLLNDLVSECVRNSEPEHVQVDKAISEESPKDAIVTPQQLFEARHPELVFGGPNIDDQHEFLRSFSLIPCAYSSSLFEIVGTSRNLRRLCSVCDIEKNHTSPESGPGKDYHEDHLVEQALYIYEITDLMPRALRPRDRVLLASSIRRHALHTHDTAFLDLFESKAGEWCLKALTSSHREVRISAGRAIIPFLQGHVAEVTRTKNRRETLKFLKTLSERNELVEQETLIMMWGQVARVCGDEELNLALLYLIDCLGHSNTPICGIAYNELSGLAAALEKAPADLIRPFWSSLAITVVQNLHTRPQKAQLLADWLSMSVNQLLILTQTDTVPYLVLTKKVDTLRRIATARGASATVRDVCTQPSRNLAAILALLLCQPSDSVEKASLELLVTAAPEFQETSLQGLICAEPILVAFEMLKRAADIEQSKKNQVQTGFHTLTVLAEGRRDKNKLPKTQVLKGFFEKHILGIMAHITAVIDSPRDPRPVSERKRCLGAIEEMINLAGELVSNAVPQIRACLQCALDEQQLRDRAFQVWITLVRAVSDDDLSILLDPTMSIIARRWSNFQSDTQSLAHDLVSDLFKNKGDLIKEHIDTFPSLRGIDMLSKFEGQVAKRRIGGSDPLRQFDAFCRRLQDESTTVVSQALQEILPFLESNQRALHESAVSQKSGHTISQLARCFLDVRARFGDDDADIARYVSSALGLIGCIDSNKVEAIREKKDILVLSNFERAAEVITFTAHLLEHILVKAFRSAPNSRAQGFLAYAMQELLRFGKFHEVVGQKPRGASNEISYQKWHSMSEPARNTLIPFVSSMYRIQNNVGNVSDVRLFPTFSSETSHSVWLRTFTFNLLQKGKGENAVMLFGVLSRVIRGHDLSIATFMLPFAALNVIIGGTDIDSSDVAQELLAILQYEQEGGQVEDEDIKQCCENVFQVLDYLSRWLHERRRVVADAKVAASRGGRMPAELDELKEIQLISSVENVLSIIPAEVISRRAVECGSYARALFHWEQYMRQQAGKAESLGIIYDRQPHLQYMQQIYSQIDEPDSIEGISAHLTLVDPARQVLEHRKAGRWSAAQSWYELSLAQDPENQDLQVDLFTCLKESGQYDSLLNYVESFSNSSSVLPSRALPFAAEAAWVTGKWDRLEKALARVPEDVSLSTQDFNMGVGKALLALRKGNEDNFKSTLSAVQEGITRSLTASSTSSLHACHVQLLKLHLLYEIDAISGCGNSQLKSREAVLPVLNQRLEIIGAYTSDKQYVLGARRAAMQLSKLRFTELDEASSWLTSATLARKSEFSNTAYNAVLHAAQLGDEEAKIEHSKLLWKEGHQRKAIQTLKGAIDTDSFRPREPNAAEVPAITHSTVSTGIEVNDQPNRLVARANLLLTKWLDQAGQTQSNEITRRYQNVIKSYARWDKGHYYLGKHYNKILEAEKALPRNKQSSSYISGEHTKLVIDNYTRSMVYGAKYYYQVVPKVLTLWLDLGMEVHEAARRSTAEVELSNMRIKNLTYVHKQLQKYAVERIPPYVFYTAFPQIITRISHPNVKVWEVLQDIILRIASAHPQQTLWALLAVVKSTAVERASRGQQVLSKLKEISKKQRADNSGLDLRVLITHGQRLTEQLLNACEVAVDARVTHVSLSKDLAFNMKLAPCQLVVPIEATMTTSLPSVRDSTHVRKHKAFPSPSLALTISSFEDDVLVLSSLQRPRKLTIVGSDGRKYGLMCKPKDDLRKDQRLMEFNAMINRSLRRDVESSKRQLYIKTYGVTPLNEECGTVEWVDNLKPIRDIIIRIYRQNNVVIDYSEIRTLLDAACANPPHSTEIFTLDILSKFAPVLHEWFTESFPDPSTWLAARHRYSRSCAVMSIVGHVLGLGDRHGENVLLDAEGGIFHVDFNCLFDKGLTFEKPELVPFRLTHNMLDAMGPAGIEGHFRVAAELVLRICRQNMDTLMTILETFVWDPTADFVGAQKKRKRTGVGADVPDTPQEVLDAVQNKLKGLMKGDSVPLGVEGYVDALIRQARSERNLAAMYIGWCAFF
ncbi:hypothetical protein EJ05DRAFT_449694 [Pseudovirgaria hyperparasitica]|uniref:Serine/threonine-protein kinase MEC1 n=1 Tax=Pseudovirgaria hyperparasitica TaxID=470096 RepID=A0A6A6WF25_9PEZI|nr:uncharacterized protein EJ05DRAFT_449694 [Pseudovirgaria hyperparasitica]KAF2761422.1 hypothetical protein EJ05DRAFT_449694 [Pseudovirgaria hyperparasitica]